MGHIASHFPKHRDPPEDSAHDLVGDTAGKIRYVQLPADGWDWEDESPQALDVHFCITSALVVAKEMDRLDVKEAFDDGAANEAFEVFLEVFVGRPVLPVDAQGAGQQPSTESNPKDLSLIHI